MTPDWLPSWSPICARSEGPLAKTANQPSAETGGQIVPVIADTSDAGSIARLMRDAAAALAVIHLRQTLAQKLGRHGITVEVVPVTRGQGSSVYY